MIIVDLNKSRFEHGYWSKLRQPAFIFYIKFTKNTWKKEALERFDQIVNSMLPSEDVLNLPENVASHPLLSRLAKTALGILSASCMPIMSGVNAISVEQRDGADWLLGLSAVNSNILAPLWAISWSSNLLNLIESGDAIDTNKLHQDLVKLIEKSKRYAPRGLNTLRILKAAHEESIPWRHIIDNVYQFGWGSRSHWLDSSFTDETSQISARLARNKATCAIVLSQAGLPVPSHLLATNETHAVELANKLGYPVVVKPANLDGGRGVLVGLSSAEAVRKAYLSVCKLSSQILIEKYVSGNDYRLQVHKREVFSVLHRRPAYIIGDGVSTIETLILEANRNLNKQKPDRSAEQARVAIVVDDELNEWLRQQGQTLKSKPASGQPIRLKGAANVSSGGTREEIPIDNVHPDNLALAERAASTLRLDLAGVDLIIPNISCSWRETGAAIIEVNAQPQISRHLLRPLIRRILRGNGRIPVIVIVGNERQAEMLRKSLTISLKVNSICLEWLFSQGATPSEIQKTTAQCRNLLSDNNIDAIIWHIATCETSVEALPFDRLDALVILDAFRGNATTLSSWNNLYEKLVDISDKVWKVQEGITPNEDNLTLNLLPARLQQLISDLIDTSIAKDNKLETK
jgi:cyanophycin synthetase